MILAIVIGIIAAFISQLIKRESRKTVQINAMISLILVSFVIFYFHNKNYDLLGLIVQLFAMLWFPAAIVLSSLIIPGVSKIKTLPVWVGVTSVLVYLIENYFDSYIAGILGLRFMNSLILIPPPAFPYAWLDIPEIYKVFIQFGVTLVLAILIFWLGLKLSRYLSQKEERVLTS
ncbi:MAG: hypothetical protein WC558_14270 [Patulibacter sp.]